MDFDGPKNFEVEDYNAERRELETNGLFSKETFLTPGKDSCLRSEKFAVFLLLCKIFRLELNQVLETFEICRR